MYYQRHIQSVVERIANRKPVIVLTGARQVGKSTMLKETYGGINYVALNRPLVRESAKENPSLFFEMNKPPIIVDEIQKAAELFDYIKDIADEKKGKGQFYLTGSQSMKLMKNVSDSLAGRAGVIKMGDQRVFVKMTNFSDCLIGFKLICSQKEDIRRKCL